MLKSDGLGASQCEMLERCLTEIMLESLCVLSDDDKTDGMSQRVFHCIEKFLEKRCQRPIVVENQQRFDNSRIRRSQRLDLGVYRP